MIYFIEGAFDYNRYDVLVPLDLMDSDYANPL